MSHILSAGQTCATFDATFDATLFIYLYKELRLKTLDLRYNESRDHYHEDGYLVPSHRYGFRFEAVSRL